MYHVYVHVHYVDPLRRVLGDTDGRCFSLLAQDVLDDSRCPPPHGLASA